MIMSDHRQDDEEEDVQANGGTAEHAKDREAEADAALSRKHDGESNADGDTPASSATEGKVSSHPNAAMDILEQSGSQRAIENLLKVYYEPLELWFLRTSIEKVSDGERGLIHPFFKPPNIPALPIRPFSFLHVQSR
jgi:hypothetical protein